MDNHILKLEILFLRTYVEYWNDSRTTHGDSNTKGLPILILDKRKARLAHVFWVSSSVTITLLLNICFNSIKMNNALFDKKTGSASVHSMLQVESVGKGRIFWSWTSLQYSMQYNGSYDVPNLS